MVNKTVRKPALLVLCSALALISLGFEPFATEASFEVQIEEVNLLTGQRSGNGGVSHQVLVQ